MREPLRERLRGRWHSVLPLLGVPEGFLNGKHQACPLCGGRDRARFDDKEGGGTWICNQCGAGDGVTLVMRINGWDFRAAAERIEAVAGGAPKTLPQRPDPAGQLAAMKRVWQAAKPIGDVVRRYLDSRGLNQAQPRDVRQASYEMIALVRDVAGKGCQIHRTLLNGDGRKAEGKCRLFMPGAIPKGAAVRLMHYADVLGIAEGIETALSAAILFGVPCWAALNATMLKVWEAPDVKRVIVFGDNDENCTGQAAAYELGRRLSQKLSVSIEIPPDAGTDWNDVLRQRAEGAGR